MTITQIVAASTNQVIGKHGKLLWSLPNDILFFKNKTWGLPIVMGRKTFNSLGSKPLKGRQNIVITRQPNYNAKGIIIQPSLEAAIAYCEQEDFKEIMIIGGGEIYKESLPITNKVYLTRVHAEFEGDTYYPLLSPDEWTLSFEENFEPDAKHAQAYSFQTWTRK